MIKYLYNTYLNSPRPQLKLLILMYGAFTALNIYQIVSALTYWYYTNNITWFIFILECIIGSIFLMQLIMAVLAFAKTAQPRVRKTKKAKAKPAKKRYKNPDQKIIEFNPQDFNRGEN